MTWLGRPVGVAFLFAALLSGGRAEAGEPYGVRIVGDAIPEPLGGLVGDPAAGRSIVADRTRGLCLLCHAGPFPDQPFQGDLSPDLAGTGSRWSAGQLRLRMVDARRLDPDTIMPPYYATDRLSRVGAAFAGRTILSAREIEDVVAYLATLKE